MFLDRIESIIVFFINDKTMKIIFILTSAALSIVLILLLLFFNKPEKGAYAVNEQAIAAAKKFVKINVTPNFDFSYDFMLPGVLQHLDRDYTYDTIPKQLQNGVLFQGIHEAPKGTIVEFKLSSPATVYIIICNGADGGLSLALDGLTNWKRSPVFPQYDIYNGDHGLIMNMYKYDADIGLHSTPESTENGACFNMVFQNKNDL